MLKKTLKGTATMEAQKLAAMDSRRKTTGHLTASNIAYALRVDHGYDADDALAAANREMEFRAAVSVEVKRQVAAKRRRAASASAWCRVCNGPDSTGRGICECCT